MGEQSEAVTPHIKTIRVRRRQTPDRTTNQCFQNVEAAVKNNGGELVPGWIVHQRKTHFAKVHHAVWLAPDGELSCVTPQLIKIIEGNVVLDWGDIDFERDDGATLLSIDFGPDDKETYNRPNRFEPRIAGEDVKKACEQLARSDKFESIGDYERADFCRLRANKLLRKYGEAFGGPDAQWCAKLRSSLEMRDPERRAKIIGLRMAA